MCNLSQGVKAEGREEGINIGDRCRFNRWNARDNKRICKKRF